MFGYQKATRMLDPTSLRSSGPGMMCAFKLFDLDRNGYVDVTEFTRVLIGFGYPGGQCKAGKPGSQVS
jgi:Ca2+-binding EF-hand superfamily protein